MSFQINRNSNIIIYGAGERGRYLRRHLQAEQINVLFYLDREYRNLQEVAKTDRTPIYQLGNEVISKEEKESCVVVICLFNALNHQMIAKELFERGYENIIYIPLIDNESKKSSYMTKIYNAFIYEDIKSIFLKDIPSYIEVNEKKEIKSWIDNLIYREMGKNITAYFPVELLFSDSDICLQDNMTITQKRKSYYVIKSAGVNLKYLDTYLKLWKYIETGEGECELYLKTQIDDICNDEEKKRILNDRYKLMNIFDYNYAYNSSFFMESAAIGTVKDGRIEIKDGHHRVTYLVYRNSKFIPVTLPKIQFYKLYNSTYMEKLLQNTNGFFIESPLAKNCVNEYKIDNRNYLYYVLRELRIWKNFENLLVACGDYGFMYRNLRRNNFQKVKDLYTENQFQMITTVNAALGFQTKKKSEHVATANDIYIIDLINCSIDFKRYIVESMIYKKIFIKYIVGNDSDIINALNSQYEIRVLGQWVKDGVIERVILYEK